VRVRGVPPDFIVIGKKGGTPSLHESPRTHPNIYLPAMRDPLTHRG